MSKRFWLPTRKGTELLPKTFQQPTKLVIRDVPAGTPLYDAVVQRFGGQLKQFHGKCQQDYSLSENATSKRRTNFGDEASAVYSNIYGQETLTLTVATKVLSELHGKLHKPHRDVILVSFDYTGMTGITATHAAYNIVPELAPLEHVAFTPTRGVALEGIYTSDDHSEHPVLSFPPLQSTQARYAAPFVNVTADGTQHSTLLWDLRPILGASPIYVVDIYAQLTDPNQVCKFTGWQADPSHTGVNISTDYSLWHEWQDLQSAVFGSGTVIYPDDYWIPRNAAIDQDNWPNTIPTGTIAYKPNVVPQDFFPPSVFSERWDGLIMAYGTSYADIDQTFATAHGFAHYTNEPYQHPVPYGTATGNYLWREVVRQDQVSSNLYNKVYERQPYPDLSRPAVVSAAFVDGARLGISHTSGSVMVDDGTPCGPYSAGQDYYSWELTDLYPRRPSTVLGTAVASAALTSEDSTMATHFDQQFLCRITYDREHDAISMSTKPPA